MFEKTNVTICDFQGPLTEEDIARLAQDDEVRLVRPWGGYLPGKRDLSLLNGFFRSRPEVWFRVTSPGQLRLLPAAQLVSEAVEGDFGENLNDLECLEHLRGVRLVERDVSPLLPYCDALDEVALEGRLRKSAGGVLSRMRRLHSLALEGTTLESFECLEGLPLRNLYVYGSRPADPSPIGKLAELRSIRVKNNSSWRDLGFISHLSRLESTSFEYCSKVTKVPPLDGLRNLRRVRFTNCNMLEDIASLWRLPRDCEILATGSTLSRERISYHYEPGAGLQDWCREHSTNLPSERPGQQEEDQQ